MKPPFRLGLAVLMVLLMIPSAAFARQDEMAAVRQVTAQFHRVEAALEAGYELGYVNGAGVRIITGCIAHPTAGAMGYHYFNKALVDDMVVDPLKPEALVYASLPNGKLKLVAVEYVVPGPGSNPPGPSGPPPTVFGMEMHILVPPPGPGFYIHPAWVWRHNPAGMFADWIPRSPARSPDRQSVRGQLVLRPDCASFKRTGVLTPALGDQRSSIVSASASDG